MFRCGPAHVAGNVSSLREGGADDGDQKRSARNQGSLIATLGIESLFRAPPPTNPARIPTPADRGAAAIAQVIDVEAMDALLRGGSSV